MPTYKTPGVYVEEVSNFPPSVVPVETAIPAFIGYTEKAIKNGESLQNKPTKIDSFVEFVAFFGGEPTREIHLELNVNNQYVQALSEGTRYYLYDCIRLFFDNGGSNCYIISVGNYENNIALGDFADPENNPGILVGLKALEKYDEPTLIVAPDAVNLGGGQLYDFQVQALRQCADLQDRFLICDLLKADEQVAKETLDDRVSEFRDRIGINNLKYGASYVPWLRSSTALELKFRDVLFFRTNDAGAPSRTKSNAILASMTEDNGIKQLIFDLINAVNAAQGLGARINPDAAVSDSYTAPSLIENEKAVEVFLNENFDDFTGKLITEEPGDGYFSKFEASMQAIYQKASEILYVLMQIEDGLPHDPGLSSLPSPLFSKEFKLGQQVREQLEDFLPYIREIITHHREIARYSVLNTEDLQLFGATTGVEIASAVQSMFDLFALFDDNLDMSVGIEMISSSQEVLDTYKSLAFKTEMLNFLDEKAQAQDTDIPATFVTNIKNLIPDNLSTAVGTVIETAKNNAGATVTANNVLARLTTASEANTASVATILAKRYYIEIIGSGEIADPTAEIGAGDFANIPDVFLEEITSIIEPIVSNLETAAAEADVSVNDSLKPLFVYDENELLVAQIEFAANRGFRIAIDLLDTYKIILESARTYEEVFDESLYEAFGAYKTLLSRAGSDIMILPPSAAIAGVYAAIDATRGVFKAPANVSLASVSGPDIFISSRDQEGLNVDANSGKSINAIRTFAGKGTLVWGARTLAGNDNEWRYVNVRRYYNFAEESIKKATEPFVFEPNDANTWAKIKGMITNFLTNQWRDGALQGAKPAQAFFVKIGLGETMTAQDVLEGRLIVEIGLAVVRPAEFIILRFSHKLPEA